MIASCRGVTLKRGAMRNFVDEDTEPGTELIVTPATVAIQTPKNDRQTEPIR